MILPGMNLSNGPTNSGTVLAYHNEQVFCHETDLLVGLHDFNMCEPLTI